MPDKPVIANNTPLVALWVLGLLSLLRDLYGEILVPETVYQEFIATDPALRQSALDGSPWIRVVSLSNPQHARVYVGLDQGEAEVLALAEEYRARLVIIDERKGRRYADRLGISLTGTLGVLLLAKERGLIAALAPLLDGLRDAGLFIDDSLVEKVLALAGELPK
jgi:predicted nucleic acid-binding protein